MGLPFTHQQFVGILQQYNLATWPVAIVFYLLALAVLFLIFSDQPYADRIICGILAVFWLWMGVAYHLLYFSVINKVAYLFGALFIAQGVIFIGCGVVRARLRYRYLDNLRSVVAALLVFYAIMVGGDHTAAVGAHRQLRSVQAGHSAGLRAAHRRHCRGGLLHHGPEDGEGLKRRESGCIAYRAGRI
jgi:hypothetical protein